MKFLGKRRGWGGPCSWFTFVGWGTPTLRLLKLGLGALVIASVFALPRVEAYETNGFATNAATLSAVRFPWIRGSIRFQRQWLLLGPIASPRAPGQPPEIDPTVDPQPGQPQPSARAAVIGTWIPSTTWSDSLDLSGNLARPAGAVPATQAVEAVGYVFTRVTVDQDGPWDLSLGLDGKFELWVNGAAVAAPAGPFEFHRESTRVRVQLKSGANRLLLRLAHHRSPWLLGLRVVAPGAVLSDLEEIAPAIVDSAGGKELQVRTHSEADPKAASVHVELLAAGGRSIASADAARGEVIKLPIGSWAEGAYEVRCTTTTAWGKTFVAYLPWYYGDPSKAVRRLDAAAEKASTDPFGATLRMLAEMAHDRLGQGAETVSREVTLKLHPTLLEFEEMEQLASGGVGPVHGGGFVRLAYADPVDDSIQFCRAYLPPDYDAARRWPVVVFLHGYNPDNPNYIRWWSVDQRHSPVADLHGTILLEMHGRGNAQYAGVGEADVLHALSEAKARFSVDDDRVYLTGESMGGHGTWYLASRHPDLFAAAAPIYGGWEPRVLHLPDGSPVAPLARNPRDAYLQELGSSFASAENLLNLPLYVQHGDSDQSVSVEYSRHIVGMLQRWGYDVRYREHVGRGHEDLTVREETADWLLTHRRVDAPTHLRLRALDLRSAESYWLRVDAFDHPSSAIVADAEMIRPGMLRLDTNNAAAVSLQLPKRLQSSDGSLTVIWNGESRLLMTESGHATVSRTEKTQGGLRKRAGVEGPISDIIRTPFAVVIGTASSDPVMRQRCEQKAEAFRQVWQQWQHQSPRVMKDSEVTAMDEKRYSLLLIGGAESNLVSRRLGEAFPLQLHGEQITIDGQTWSVKDGYVQLIYPSPFQPDRYVMVVAGTSADGLYFWKPNLWAMPLGYANTVWDWTIQDGRRVSLPPERPQEGWIASGVFDARWRRTEEWTTVGNSELRAHSPLRRVPNPNVSASPSLLDAIAGRYQVFPGVTATFLVRGSRVFAQLSGMPEVEMLFAGENEFVSTHSIAEALFDPAEKGVATSAKLYFDGKEYIAKRVP